MLEADVNVLLLPGHGNSGPGHWQTHWERNHPAYRRVNQRDWDRPVCSDWIARLEVAVALSGPRTVLVAHSLGALLVAHWAVSTSLQIQAALLVAVPDPSGAIFPDAAVGFSPLPHQPLHFRSILVASTNDPFAGVEFARQCARNWRSRFVNIGAAGHINADSGLGEWPEGLALLHSLTDS